MKKVVAIFLAVMLGGAGGYVPGNVVAAQVGENAENGQALGSGLEESGTDGGSQETGVGKSRDGLDQGEYKPLDNSMEEGDKETGGANSQGIIQENTNGSGKESPEDGSQDSSKEPAGNSGQQMTEGNDKLVADDEAQNVGSESTEGCGQDSDKEDINAPIQNSDNSQGNSQESMDDSSQTGEKESVGDDSQVGGQEFAGNDVQPDGSETSVDGSQNSGEKPAENDSQVGDTELSEAGAENSAQSASAPQEGTGGNVDDINRAEQLMQLQMPQKLGIVIDPYEIDGKGQIYSEEYVIKNNGKTAGLLTLSKLLCVPAGEYRVDVRTDTEGIHEGKENAIYMELVFGNGDKAVFSQEGSSYEVRLEPEEELTLRFAGEVNENASRQIESTDIEVSVTYVWEVEKAVAQKTVSDSGKAGLDSQSGVGSGQEGLPGTADDEKTDEETGNQAGAGVEKPADSAGGEENTALGAGEPLDEGAGENSGLLDSGELPAFDAGENSDAGTDEKPEPDVAGNSGAGIEERPDLGKEDEVKEVLPENVAGENMMPVYGSGVAVDGKENEA